MRKWGKRVSWAIAGLVGIATGIQLDQFYQAAEQQHASYNYQPAQNPGFRINAVTKTPTAQYNPSCNNPYEREDSDLCAQWASVDQMSESNRLNSLNLRILVLTLLLTTVGTWALVWTFFDQRRTTRAELRAYVFPESGMIVDGSHHQLTGDREGIPRVLIQVKNFGSTPAHQVRHWAGFILFRVREPFEPPAPNMLQTVEEGMAPTAVQTYDRPLTFDPTIPENWMCPTPETIDLIRVGEVAVMAYGRIEYFDAFGQMRITNYRLAYSGEWPPHPDMRFRYCPEGNNST